MGYQYRGNHEGPDLFDEPELACGEMVGTGAGALRHRRAGEKPCEECRVGALMEQRARTVRARALTYQGPLWPGDEPGDGARRLAEATAECFPSWGRRPKSSIRPSDGAG